MRINLTVEEVRVLRGILESQINDPGAESHHARTPGHHGSLKALRDMLKKLDRELSEASP